MPAHVYASERQTIAARHGRRPCPRGSRRRIVGEAQSYGCPICWSTRYWRLYCRACGYVGPWVDGASRAEQDHALSLFAGHDPDAAAIFNPR